MDNMNEKYAAGLLPFHPIVLVKDVAKRWLLIVLAALVVGVGSYIVTDRAYTPSYQTSATYVVTSSGTSTTVYSNLSAANELATVFTELLNSSVMRKTILQQLGQTYFDGTINASVIPETNLLTVSVTSSDPRTAFAVIQAVIDHHSIVTDQIMNGIVLEILQYPKIPVAPSNYADAAGTMKKMAVYAAIAMCAVLAFMSYSRNTVRSSKEAKEKLDCNFLGEVPHENKYKTIPAWIRQRKTSILITNPVTSFRFVENMRKLRRRIEKRMQGDKVLMVTSLMENEGKSTVAVNLALAMAQKHEKVLLIDCDLRKPACHILLDERDVPYTVRDVLGGQVLAGEAIVRDKLSKLNLLLEKRGGADSDSFLASQAMHDLLRWAREEYDFVVLDLPPMFQVTDAESMTAYADASVLVVRQNVAHAVAVNKAVADLAKGKAKLLGSVLNDVDTMAMSTGRGYGYGYGKYGKYGHYGKYNHYSNYGDHE